MFFLLPSRQAAKELKPRGFEPQFPKIKSDKQKNIDFLTKIAKKIVKLILFCGKALTKSTLYFIIK